MTSSEVSNLLFEWLFHNSIHFFRYEPQSNTCLWARAINNFATAEALNIGREWGLGLHNLTGQIKSSTVHCWPIVVNNPVPGVVKPPMFPRVMNLDSLWASSTETWVLQWLERRNQIFPSYWRIQLTNPRARLIKITIDNNFRLFISGFTTNLQNNVSLFLTRLRRKNACFVR